MNTQAIYEQFQNPGNAYRGKPFWSWNGELQKDELIRQANILGQMGFIIVGIIMFVVMMIIVPISLLKRKKQMEQIMKDFDAMQEEADKQSYEKFEYEYKSYRNGIPEMNDNMSDPAMKEARQFFEGYTATKEMLKSRFRFLAKKYHPDNGGDEILFQSISFVYDELTSKV